MPIYRLVPRFSARRSLRHRLTPPGGGKRRSEWPAIAPVWRLPLGAALLHGAFLLAGRDEDFGREGKLPRTTFRFSDARPMPDSPSHRQAQPTVAEPGEPGLEVQQAGHAADVDHARAEPTLLEPGGELS